MTNSKLNFIFFGTPDVASETLEILKNGGYIPSLIVTAPDKPQGRKMIVTPPPVKVWAQKNNVPFIQPEKITPSAFDTSPLLRGRTGRGHDDSIDLFVVVAYGKILPEAIINMPALGTINIHYSLLPKYRGASPVESAILNGDTETGISIQQMEFKMDTGPIIAEEKVAIGQDEKTPELRKRLIKIGGDFLVKTLPDIADKKITPRSQEEVAGGVARTVLATYCKKMTKEDGLIDLLEDGVKNYNKFRAYAFWPRTFFFQNGKRIIITDAELKDGKFVMKKVLPEGKKEISWEEFSTLM